MGRSQDRRACRSTSLFETERETQARSGQFAPKREIQQEFMWSLAKRAALRAEDALCKPACCWHLRAGHTKDEPYQKGLQNPSGALFLCAQTCWETPPSRGLAVFQVARARLSHSPASPGVLGSE